MSEEPANQRLARIKLAVQADLLVTLDDMTFVLTRLSNAERMLASQQRLVGDAAERGRKIGYEDGYSDGYDAACTALDAQP